MNYIDEASHQLQESVSFLESFARVAEQLDSDGRAEWPNLLAHYTRHVVENLEAYLQLRRLESRPRQDASDLGQQAASDATGATV